MPRANLSDRFPPTPYLGHGKGREGQGRVALLKPIYPGRCLAQICCPRSQEGNSITFQGEIRLGS